MEDIEKPFSTTAGFHLAGVVPIAGQPLDFKMDWPDCMMPVAPNFTMIEAAVHECAWAGCETIWLICNDDISPLLRYRIGDFVEDPVWANRHMDYRPSESRSRIPVFYVPIHSKDRDKRDCTAWSVIHGALTCLKISSKISKWLLPDKYYVSFPYGIFPPQELRPLRKKISSHSNFYVLNNGEAVDKNHYTSFTFGKDEFIKYRRVIRKEGTGMHKGDVINEYGLATDKLPIEERYSARFFDLARVFRDLDLDEAETFEPSWFHNMGSWEDYKTFIGSDKSSDISRPWKRIMKYREFNLTGVDVE